MPLISVTLLFAGAILSHLLNAQSSSSELSSSEEDDSSSAACFVAAVPFVDFVGLAAGFDDFAADFVGLAVGLARGLAAGLATSFASSSSSSSSSSSLDSSSDDSSDSVAALFEAATAGLEGGAATFASEVLLAGGFGFDSSSLK